MVERIEIQPSSIRTSEVEHPQFANGSHPGQEVNPYVDGFSSISSLQYLDNATGNTYEEILNLSDQIREAKGEAPLDRGSTIRRLHAILVRIAELTENHVFQRKEKDYDKKRETLKNVDTIQMWTRLQGGAHFASGIGYSFLFMVGSLIGGSVAEALKSAKNLVPSAARAFENAAESYKQHPQFEKELYIQTAASDRQALEGLKGMPRELQQKLMQLLRQELDAIRATGQR